jgi:hypothetical protein
MKRITTTPTKAFNPDTEIDISLRLSYKELCAIVEQLKYTTKGGSCSPGNVVDSFRELLVDSSVDAGLPDLEVVPVDRHLTHRNASVTFVGWPTVWPK